MTTKPSLCARLTRPAAAVTVLVALLGATACDPKDRAGSLADSGQTQPAASEPAELPSTGTATATAAPPATTKSVATKKAAPPTTRPPTVVPTTTRPPSPKPAPKPVALPTCGAAANPWGYNFCGRGSVIADPPGSFCDFFDCIPSFWESTNGYVMQCDDLMFSHSGGRSGSCSHHGGNNRALYG
jgi:hypothetical protein